MKVLVSTIFLLAFFGPPAKAQIFADFKTKTTIDGAEFGTFTVSLDFLLSPRATANFIRLAEGLTPWIDPATGEVRTDPFYNGLPFHDVTSLVEVVTGSPDGSPTGGPGWIFRDDFRSQVQEVYSVYMDNDGPNTNGSRIFINLPTVINPVLRSGRYTKIGTVQTTGGGRIVVFNIANSFDDAISIDEVTFRYVGILAQAFRTQIDDPTDPVLGNLPSARAATFDFRRENGTLFLHWNDSPGTILQLYGSPDLHNWTGPLPLTHYPGSDFPGYDLTFNLQFAPTAFFRGPVIDYPIWPSTERPLRSASLSVNYLDPVNGSIGICFTFDAEGTGGTYSSFFFGAGEFTVTENEILNPFLSDLRLTADTGALPDFRFLLHYDLNGTTNTTADVSRMTAQFVDGGGPSPIYDGEWRYVIAPCP